MGNQIKILFLAVGAVLFNNLDAYSADKRTEICVDFKVGVDRIYQNYQENDTRLAELVDLLSDSDKKIVQVTFCGSASPEGGSAINKRLSRNRMLSIEKYVKSKVAIPDSLISHDDLYVPWGYLTGVVASSTMEGKDEAVKVMSQYTKGKDSDAIVAELKQLNGGVTWKEMNRRFFPGTRKACALVTLSEEDEPVVVEVTPITPEPVQEPMPEPEPMPEVPVAPAPVVPDTIVPVDTIVVNPNHWYLKTNLVGWGMAAGNIGYEVDFGKRWSFAIQAYYSALNYFTRTLKFRTLSFQPEIRYWLTGRDGFFVGGHFGLSWYNYAFNGHYRYQDHNGRRPSPGGGLSIGYRMPIGKNGKWRLEFAVGAGIYHLNYDRYVNEPNGAWVDRKSDTYYGVDNAAISIVYTFDKKNRRKK